MEFTVAHERDIADVNRLNELHKKFKKLYREDKMPNERKFRQNYSDEEIIRFCYAVAYFGFNKKNTSKFYILISICKIKE